MRRRPAPYFDVAIDRADDPGVLHAVVRIFRQLHAAVAHPVGDDVDPKLILVQRQAFETPSGDVGHEDIAVEMHFRLDENQSSAAAAVRTIARTLSGRDVRSLRPRVNSLPAEARPGSPLPSPSRAAGCRSGRCDTTRARRSSSAVTAASRPDYCCPD